MYLDDLSSLLKLNPLMDGAEALYPSNHNFNNFEARSFTMYKGNWWEILDFLDKPFYSSFLHQAHRLFFDFHLHYRIIGNNQWKGPKHDPAANWAVISSVKVGACVKWPFFKVSIKRTVDYPSIMEFERWGIELSKSFLAIIKTNLNSL